LQIHCRPSPLKKLEEKRGVERLTPALDTQVLGSAKARREHVRKDSPDVIVLGRALPDQSGLEAERRERLEASAPQNVVGIHETSWTRGSSDAGRDHSFAVDQSEVSCMGSVATALGQRPGDGTLFAFALPQVATTTERHRPEVALGGINHVSANPFIDRTDSARRPWDVGIRETGSGAKRRVRAYARRPGKRRQQQLGFQWWLAI